MGICTVDDCNNPSSARGWCKKHYSRWFRHGDVGVRKNEEQSGLCLVDGCQRPQKTNHLCNAHQRRAYVWGDVRADKPLRPTYTHDRVTTEQGYIRIKVPGHPRGGRYGWVLEHIVVMEGQLRRELLPGESVHHIDGVRDDNRPENLELWVSAQPGGQRPSDLLKWAYEIIARYGGLTDVVERTAV